MSNKQTYIVSPELNMGAQFKAIDHIPTNHVHAGDVIQVLPGSYHDPRTTNVADVTIVGMGDAKDIIFAGFSIPSGITADQFAQHREAQSVNRHGEITNLFTSFLSGFFMSRPNTKQRTKLSHSRCQPIW